MNEHSGIVELGSTGLNEVVGLLRYYAVFQLGNKEPAMSIFNTILSKLGFGDKEEAPTPAPVVQDTPVEDVIVEQETITPISEVDVLAQLEALAEEHGGKSNWRVSIADLLRVLGLDYSLAARKELAAELGCPEEKIGGDYSAMNIWLHKEVLRKLAENGGNIPADLLD